MLAPAADLIPVRALNQISYCQRLYYLEYVEGLMPTNEFVEDGTFQHRRVNAPELEQRARKEKDCLHTRSVTLSSEKLGITAKLDLVEEEDDAVYPVEYKRSAGPPVAKKGCDPLNAGGQNPFLQDLPPYWENDAIQLCAQGMLLEEERGTPVTKGILYYMGSKRRVEVALDDALRGKTLAAIALARDLSGRDAPPEPLPAELRHRCHGCSLVTVCQPEETLFLIGRQPLPPAAEQEAGLTRVLPESDNGAVLYLQEPGSSVGKRSEHLEVRKDGQVLQKVPISAVRHVVVFGNVQVSTQALECLASNEVPVVYLSPYGRFLAALQPAPTKNAMLRADQYRVFNDPARAMGLSRAVVKAKVANQRTLLMRNLRSTAPDDSAGSDEPAARDMAELLGRLERVVDPAVLLGTEGQAAALYFSQFSRMFKNQIPGREFDFHGRNRRPPRDPVNALLSLGYSLLAKDCFSAVCTVGFDPYQGFFHRGRHGRPSLALDLMEEFRAILVDSVVLGMINKRMLTPGDFLTWREACQLTEDGRRQFFGAYEQRKATVVTHPVFGYKMSYSRMLEVQARMLAGYVRGDIPEYAGFTVR